MKKTTLIIVALSLLSLTACAGEFKKDERPDAAQRQEAVKEYMEPKPFEKTVSFSGPATKTDYFCLEDCDPCESKGTMTISLLPDGSAVAGFSGDCYVFGQGGCTAMGDKCLDEFKGVYLKAQKQIVFSTCSGGDKAESTATFDEDASDGSARCYGNGQMTLQVAWDSLPKLNQ
jgi:hypothetical protein